MKEYILGIDLGTTNTCVSIIEAGDPVVISSSEGGRTIPSVVSWKKDGERIVGTTAKRSAITNSKNTIFSAKRFIGHTFEEIKDEVSKVPYVVKESDKGLPVFEIPAIDKDVSPEEVSAAVLQKCKADAEAYLGAGIEIKKAVVTVPAYFSDSQKKQTKVAGEIAGLEVIRIINEPTAAALAYGLNKNKDENVLVFDLGGGTFDVTVMSIAGEDGVFEVLSSNGDSRLGGDDFDDKIADHLIADFKKEHGVDLSKDSSALSRIKDAAEKAKIELSSQMSTNVNLPFITAVDGQPAHLNVDLTRAKFDSLTEGLLKKIAEPVKTALKDAVKGDKSKINEVILVGGSSRIPSVQKLIKDLIGIEPNKSVSPDECVALGAALMGGILAGDVKDIVLLDCTSLSLGVEVNGGLCDILIPKNTTIPTQKKSVYSTAVDNQNSVTINILQGERSLAKDNKSLGMFNLDGIPPARRGVPQIQVTFDIDANGLLNVSAKDLSTNKEQSITVTQSANLTQEEIDQMIKEAEMYAEQDKEAKELIESRNELDMLIFSSKSACDEAKDKVEESLINNVQEAIAQAEEAVKTGGKEEVQEAKGKLIEASHALSQKLYEKVQDGNSNVDPEVVDAEFTEA